MSFIYDLSDTWNSAGTTFTAVKMNVTDITSNAASLLMDLQTGGTSTFSVAKLPSSGYTNAVLGGTLTLRGGRNQNLAQVTVTGCQLALAGGGQPTAGVYIGSAISYGWWSLSDVNAGGAVDLQINRDAADVLAQRRGTNAQALRVYNTFTDASNYERISIGWSSNTLTLAAENAGTGSNRGITLQGKAETIVESTLSQVTLKTGGSSRWFVSAAGLLGAVVDNTLDIGGSGANRPRNLYMGSWIRMATTTVASLPAAATAGAGARMFVTDASAPVFGSAVAGGGAVTVPVYSTGSAWNVG